MKIPSARQVRLAALLGMLVSGTSHADWATSTDLAAVKPVPESLQNQPQNPPGFSWSRYAGATTSTWYVLLIQPPNGAAPIKTVTGRNWYLPAKAFTISGNYSWKVSPFTRTAKMVSDEAAIRANGLANGLSPAVIDAAVVDNMLPAAEAGAINWSTPRTFVLGKVATVFEVPGNGALRAAVLAHPRSRSLPVNFLTYKNWTAPMLAERGVAVKRLKDDVNSRIGVMLPVKDSDWAITSTVMTAALTAQNSDIRNRINRAGHQLEAAALLYRLFSDNPVAGPVYLKEAIGRGDELAALNPDGATSYVNQDQGTRVISLSLSKALDMLWPYLDATRRQTWLKVINLRTISIYNDLAGNNGRMDQYPYDSHGGNTLGFLALISALTVGEIPAAQNWFDFSVRTYIHQVFAWSGPEGGYANGTAYGQGAADLSLQIWDPLAQATGANLYKKPWAAGFAQFFVHFVPPGARTHVFGDGHEDLPNPNFLKAYASRFATPAARWYYINLIGDEDPLTLLQTPSPLPVNTVTTAVPPANAALYPSIGWSAMHSDLADRMRTSLYFKSSPFGAFNHSHGDQNSIVLSSGGRTLLMEAGFYDWYGSPTWNGWYRQTKSHNAITYDNGIGQGTDGNNINLTRSGKIVSFSTTPTLDYVEGSAVPAYDGVLSTATRRVWYLRGKDVVVVLDTLAAPAAHSFEWNLHAPVVINGAGAKATIVNVDRQLCITSLGANTSFVKRVGVPPKVGFEDHAAFVLPPSTKGEFLMLLDVGCKKPAVSLVTGASSRTLTIGGQVITLPK